MRNVFWATILYMGRTYAMLRYIIYPQSPIYFDLRSISESDFTRVADPLPSRKTSSGSGFALYVQEVLTHFIFLYEVNRDTQAVLQNTFYTHEFKQVFSE